MDQPAGLLNKLAWLDAIYRAMKEYQEIKPGKRAKWKREHPHEWELVKRYGESRTANHNRGSR
jgi:hypothetical protein